MNLFSSSKCPLINFTSVITPLMMLFRIPTISCLTLSQKCWFQESIVRWRRCCSSSYTMKKKVKPGTESTLIYTFHLSSKIIHFFIDEYLWTPELYLNHVFLIFLEKLICLNYQILILLNWGLKLNSLHDQTEFLIGLLGHSQPKLLREYTELKLSKSTSIDSLKRPRFMYPRKLSIIRFQINFVFSDIKAISAKEVENLPGIVGHEV